MSETKTCYRCGKDLPLDQFYDCPTGVDGHAARCIECQKNAVYEQREQNRANGLTSNGTVPMLTASEIAIQRHRQKRREEKEIEIRLRESEPEVTFEPTQPFLVSEFLRKPTGVKYHWECPVGTSSR